MQGAELHELLRLRHVRLGHQRGVGKDLAAVEDSVADGVDPLRGVAEVGDDLRQGGGVVLGAAAADALDEPLGEARLGLHVEELVLE